MIIQLLGYNNLDYVSKKTNKRVIGSEIHGIRLDAQNNNFVGKPVYRAFISNLTLSLDSIDRVFKVDFDVFEVAGKSEPRPIGLQEVVNK